MPKQKNKIYKIGATLILTILLTVAFLPAAEANSIKNYNSTDKGPSYKSVTTLEQVI